MIVDCVVFGLELCGDVDEQFVFRYIDCVQIVIYFVLQIVVFQLQMIVDQLVDIDQGCGFGCIGMGGVKCVDFGYQILVVYDVVIGVKYGQMCI